MIAAAVLGLASLVAVPASAAADTGDTTSRIQSAESDGANLRSCPALPNAGVTTGECGVLDRLTNGVRVRMRCWTDGTPPGEGLSPRWFWVTEVDGPTPGRSGYVWADLVAEQIDTPQCDGLRFDYEPSEPQLLLEPGPPAPAGYRYAITLNGFPADADITVTCHDSASPAGFWTFNITADAVGSAFTDRQCWSNDGPDHWVTAGDAVSSPISW